MKKYQKLLAAKDDALNVFRVARDRLLQVRDALGKEHDAANERERQAVEEQAYLKDQHASVHTTIVNINAIIGEVPE